MTLVVTEGDPAPEGAEVAWLTARDGTRLRVAHWLPPGAARGTVVLLNGRTEYIEKHFELVQHLLASDFAVATCDWRGQGLSGRALPNPQKGHVADFGEFLSDLRQWLEERVIGACPGPYQLCAHSMGANIGLRHLGEHPGFFERALFSAPMWRIDRGGSSLGVRCMGALGGALGLQERYVPFGGGDPDERNRRFAGNALTGDRARFERALAQIDAEPGLSLGGPTFGWLRAALHSIDRLWSPGFAEAIDIPIRVCLGAQDRVVPSAEIGRLTAGFPAAELVEIEGARHELLREAEPLRGRMLEGLDAFFA